VELAFRLIDQAGTLADSAPSLRRDDHKTYVVLENVKPEDTEGVKAMNTPPDEVQFVTDLELQARDAMVKAVSEKAAHLPEKILQQARQRSQQQDIDGAAAQYIVFLNSTPDNASPERAEATSFLREHFNLAVAATTSSVRQAQMR
jgi:SpoVK/Ycf46/Vps4 family AAA+-type ATPase